jgi:hypothetical protein
LYQAVPMVGRRIPEFICRRDSWSCRVHLRFAPLMKCPQRAHCGSSREASMVTRHNFSGEGPTYDRRIGEQECS